jgi:hypothetical protein
MGEFGARPSAGPPQLGVRHTVAREPDGFGTAGVPQVERERGGRAAIVRVGCQAAADDRDELGRRLGRQLGEVGEVASGRHRERVGRRGGVPRGDPGEGVEGRGGHAEDVGGGAGRSPACHGGVDVRRSDLGGRGLPQDPCHAQVGEHGPALGGEHDVARGQVTVDDAVVVRVRERGRHRRHGRHHLPGTQPPAPRQQRREAATGEQLEHERHPCGSTAPRLVHHLDQADQVRVIQRAEQRCLARLPLRIPCHQHLDGDRFPAAPRQRPPHLPRATATEERLQHVAGDRGRDGSRHGRTVGPAAPMPLRLSTGRPAALRPGPGYGRPMSSRAEVVVVGAGLAGLSAATRLSAAGIDVQVVEAGGHAGGRLATVRIDGFVVDRGFQVLNTGYPRAADLDLDALRLGWFERGAIVRVDGVAHRVVDPRQRPTGVLGTATAPIGSLREKAALAAFSLRAGCSPVRRLLAAPERTAEQALRAAGVGATALDRFFRPFLAGVLLEDELATSSRYLDLLWRSFVRGATGLPADGMQAVGEQLAGRLEADRLHLHTPVRAVGPGSVLTDAGGWRADAVVVATDPGTAARLLPTVEASAPRQVTTHFHVLPASPWGQALIVLGQPQGRVVNSVVLTDAQPRYSPDGRALVASSTLEPTREAEVRDEVAAAHGVAPSDLDHLTSVTVPGAQPAALPPLRLRRPVDLGDGVYVCGDHRDTPSIQGAMASGARAARAVLRVLRPSPPDDRRAS